VNLAFRQAFGMGNPNTAGALFAVLIFVVFLRPCRTRVMLTLRIALIAVLFAGLLLTASRGALIALGFGALGAWGAAGFCKLPKKWLVIGIVGIAALALVFGSKATARLGTLGPDEGSTASRVAVYSAVPVMLASAPFGWGDGANAYANWFQPATNNTSFKNLLSTHATWMVDRGWLFSAFYCVAWALALLITLARPAAFGALVTWGVCLAWSHVGGAWWMWLAPLGALGLALRERAQSRPPRSHFLAAAMIPLIALSILLATGAIRTRDAIFNDGQIVRVGEGEPTLWFLQPDISVLGKTYGKTLRDLAPLVVTDHWAHIPPGARLVVSGKVTDPPTPPVLTEIVWLNPPAQPSHALAELLKSTPQTTLVWGDLRSDANPTDIQKWSQSHPNIRWLPAAGRGKYLSDSDWAQLFSKK
jgi:hypothetical protein